MEIKRYYAKRATIEDFADSHGLVMEVRERANPSLPRFFASFERAEVMSDGALVSTFGSGDTEWGAITDYARRISGTRLAIDAYKSDRREIDVPILDCSPKEA